MKEWAAIQGKWKEHERLVAILEMCGADKTHSSSPQIDMSSGTVGEAAGYASLINVSITLGLWHAAFDYTVHSMMTGAQ